MPGGVEPTAEHVARLRTAGCVFAEEEAALLVLAAAERASLDDLVRRRCDGEPLEHILGWAAFCGRRIEVDPGVFVPRPRTELLARVAVSLARSVRPRPVVVDLCCGSGALGVVVAAGVPGVELHAADLDPRAVRCARRNLPGVQVHQGDLFSPLPASLHGRVHVLIANVPYVPSSSVGLLPREAREHEPRLALDGGDDGLEVLRRVAAAAPAWLAPGGALLCEVAHEQVARACGDLAAIGLTVRVERDDELGATALVAVRQSAKAL